MTRQLRGPITVDRHTTPGHSASLGHRLDERTPVEVKIGVTHANRELTFESTQSPEDMQQAISDALASDRGLLVLNDEKGRTLYVPVDKLAYVELSGEQGRRVGFGAA